MSVTDSPKAVDEALARADELVAGGRWLDAVEELTRCNRETPHHAIEQRLVDVRQQAFAELPKQPGRPAWPASFPDPFPDEGGVPEIAPGALTGDLLGGALVHHGCLKVNGLLAGDAVERLRDHIDRAFEARERLAEGGELADAAPWFVPYAVGREKAEGFGRDGFVRTVDAPRALFELADLFDRTGVRRAVTDYLAERPAMIANKWVLRRQDHGLAITDFHQDGAFLGEGIRTVDCWIALSPCGPGTGRPGLDVVPRRFDVIPPGEGAVFGWSLAESTVLEAAGDAPVVAPVFQPGDALFFDERLPHRTGVGLDLQRRYAVESWFVAPSSYPDRHVPVVL